MKILMLVPFLPNIETSGGQTRWFNILRYLSKDHDITLYSLIKDKSERKFIPPLEKYCQKVRVFRRPKSPWTLRNILLTGFSWYPLLVVRNFSFEERKAIKEELSKEKYDLIHAETFYVMPHIPKTQIPSVLVEQTIEFEVYKHYVMKDAPSFVKPILMIDVLKLKYWEMFFWKKADKLVAVSTDDESEMKKLIPNIKVDIIPNGVDSIFFESKIVKKKEPPRILYGVTNFEWLQNREAAEILIHDVWPKIRRKFPLARIWIVGRRVPEWIIRLSKNNKEIEITENIEDTRDAYKGATIMVAPIKGAGGTRLKILEAMASGLPVVSTQVGIAGLLIEHGKQALIANTNKGLANCALKLLNNPKFAEKIGNEGKKHVQKYFDWQSIVKLHDPIYKELLSKKYLL